MLCLGEVDDSQWNGETEYRVSNEVHKQADVNAGHSASDAVGSN